MRVAMIVCICHRVSDRAIQRAVNEGCDLFDALQDELRVATACGACRDCAIECFSGQAARIEVRRASLSAAGSPSPATAAAD